MAAQARDLTSRFAVNPDRAETAALLHDHGGIFERGEMVALCLSLRLPVEAEERQVPMLHAKLSEVLARALCAVTDAGVLQAVRYHTILHGARTPLDEVVFLADKLEWEQGGTPPYHADLTRALQGGLHAASRWMLGWMASPEAWLLMLPPDLQVAWTRYGIATPAA